MIQFVKSQEFCANTFCSTLARTCSVYMDIINLASKKKLNDLTRVLLKDNLN